jgi:hypothetical protein
VGFVDNARSVEDERKYDGPLTSRVSIERGQSYEILNFVEIIRGIRRARLHYFEAASR